MKRYLALLFVLFLVNWPIVAQGIDESFVFVDTDGNIIENGSINVRNVVEVNENGDEVINANIFIKNMTGSTDYLKMHYEIVRLDNGAYQIVFPSTCITQEEEGEYETAIGQLMENVQNILSEWFPENDGECIVKLTLELYTKAGGFPPVYNHKAWGPSITVKFAKGDDFNLYCVDGIYYHKTGENTVAVTFKDENYNSYQGNIIIPESVVIEGETCWVTSIAKNAFRDCNELYHLSIPVTITSIASNAFKNCNVSEICIYGIGGWQAGALPIDSIGTLYICSGITFIGGLNVNPSSIYSYSVIPPNCDASSFSAYDAAVQVPTSAMANYFTAPYWYYFANISADAIEPQTVTLNKYSVELEMGQELNIAASVNPNNATPNSIGWYSTNNDIAIVNDGIVTPVSIGECDVIAFCADKQAICHVIVVPARITIALDKHEAQVLPNHLISLTATCSPNSTELAVTSSDNTIAMPRIVNGTIQVLGLKEGTATITVGSADGTAYSDTCLVTVYTEPGDANCDGFVDINDVTLVINYLLGNEMTFFKIANADVCSDGTVDINDVTALIDFILKGRWPWQQDQTFNLNGVSFKMIYVEGGTFNMGATEDDTNAFEDEKPAHQVSLSDFFIGETEVTQALWSAVMNSNPSFFFNPDYPVENISWNNCQTFITRLNQMTGKTFRLLTEAEWEFAARGGNMSHGYIYAGSNNVEEVAWYDANSNDKTHAVATKKPNELGIYDMTGNVCEWCQDWYGGYVNSPQTDPTGPSSGNYKVKRGSSYSMYLPINNHISKRFYASPSVTNSGGGLRLAL